MLKRKRFCLVLFSTMILSFVFFSQCRHQVRYDLAITDGHIITGDGNPWYKADIGIKKDQIIFIGEITPSSAKKTINAKGFMICPGFIDIHTHADKKILEIPTADNYILQGVTTVLGGNCGSHHFPLKNLFDKLEKKGITLNFCCLAGHNTIRKKIMGLKMTEPTDSELQEMKNLVSQELEAGGLGFSTGLIYMPGTYAKTNEILDIVSVVAKYNGLYASHIRDEGGGITDAIKEAIRIGETNGIRIQISHTKLSREIVWGQLFMITDPIDQARKRSVEVTIDQYPYTATSSGFSSSFPSWALEGGKEELKKRLNNPELYKKIKSHIIKKIMTSVKGIEKLKTIYIAKFKKEPRYQGKNLHEILTFQGKETTVENGADLIIDIQKNGGGKGVFFRMDEGDVEKIMALEYTMIASDSGIIKMDEGAPHCRNYGTFPRVISHYVNKRKILSLEEAVRKMTSLPAQTLRLNKRGLIHPGFYADLVIFDPATIKDLATYQEPHQYPSGIRYVFVNGITVAIDGKITGAKPGHVLRRRSK